MASFAEMCLLPVPPTRFFVRGRDGLHCFRGPQTVTPDDGVITTPKDTDNALNGVKNLKIKPLFSPDGMFVCMVSDLPGKPVVIHEANTGKLVAEVPATNVEYVEFSPRGTYLVTWSRPKATENVPTLLVWHIATVTNVLSYHQKSQKQETLQWTDDEAFFCQLVTNEVRIMRGSDMAGGAISKVFHRGITQYKVAPVAAAGSAGCTIGVFVPEKGGKPASASLYVFPGEGEVQGPTATVTIFSATETKLLWNATGTSLLCHTSTDVDHSNTSYYGATGLYVLGTAALNNITEKVTQSKEGPIHDVRWNPAGDRFVLAAGNMPARCTLYNAKAEMVYEFGEAHRNAILWSPHGRFLCLAGFGNLAGEMDFYDVSKNCKKIGTNTAHCSVSYGWSPDSRYFITAVLAPRMNVDNGFKIFKYNGVGPVVKVPFDQAYDCLFQPLPATQFPSRGQSPRREGDVKPVVVVAAPPAAKPAAYRPPGSTGISGGLADMLRRESAPVGKIKSSTTVSSASPAAGKGTGQGMRAAPRAIPGMPDAGTSKVKEDPAIAEAKKEAKKKAEKEKKEAAAAAKAKEEEEAREAAKQAALLASMPKPIEELSGEEKEKRAKNLRKKLKAIDELKAKAASGAELNDDQKQKIACIAEILADLEKLGV